MKRIFIFIILVGLGIGGYYYSQYSLYQPRDVQIDRPVANIKNDVAVVCEADTKTCPNGAIVGRFPPRCDFRECPIGPQTTTILPKGYVAPQATSTTASSTESISTTTKATTTSSKTSTKKK